MPALTLTLAEVVNRLGEQLAMRRAAAVTSVTTGNPTLRGMRLERWDAFVSLTYRDEEWVAPEERDAAGIGAVAAIAAEHGLRRGFDLVIVDPFHTYASSVRGLGLGLSLARPGGLVVVHDCLPPVDLIGAEYVPGWWCGLTFAAFRDAVEQLRLPWCVIDADFGIGICVAGDAEPDALEDALLPGRTAAHDAEASRVYSDGPYAAMRGIDPSRFDEALDRLRRGEPVDDLVVTDARMPAHPPRPRPAGPWARMRRATPIRGRRA